MAIQPRTPTEETLTATNVSDYQKKADIPALTKEFGLQTSSDVIAFLNSHEGTSMIAEIMQQLAELASLQEEQRLTLLQEIRRDFFLSLFLDLALEEKVDAMELNRAVEAYNQLRLKASKTSIESTLDEAKQRSIIEQQLLQKHKELMEAVQGKAVAVQQYLEMKATYKRYHAAVDEITSFIDNDLALAHSTDRETARAKVVQKLMTLEQKLEHETTATAQQGKKPVASPSMAIKRQELDLQQQVLNQFLSVLDGINHLFKEDGTKTTSFSEAFFVLPKTHHVVYEDSQYHLVTLSHDMSLEQAIQSMDRMAARQAYQQMHPSLLSVRHRLYHTERLESQTRLAEIQQFTAQCNGLQSDVTSLTQQLFKLQPKPNQSSYRRIDDKLSASSGTPKRRVTVDEVAQSRLFERPPHSYTSMRPSMKPSARIIADDDAPPRSPRNKR